MKDSSNKSTSSRRKKSRKSSEIAKRNARDFLDKLLYGYSANEYDCQLCEFYGGQNQDGTVSCLAKSCDMIKDFDDLSSIDDIKELDYDSDRDDWENENDELAGILI